MARYFRLPFAVNGDKDILPDNTVNTAVSYDTGYTPDYQRDPVTDPLARNPERNIFNQLMFDITDTLRDLYETGAPPFIAPSDNNNQPFLYPQGALVRFNNRVYESLTGNNGTTPSDTDNWQPNDIAGNDARYLLESNNLSDLADPTAARANLSISSTAETDARYLQEANNLSDLSDAATARTNLQLGTAAQSNVGTGPSDLITTSEADSRFDGRYLNESANLSDLPNAATARTNLSVYSRADTYTRTESDDQYLNESANLSDLPSVSSARNNLGLGSSAVVDTGTGSSQIPTTSQADARYLQEASNLSDLDNAATARTNLELGTAAQAQVNQFIYPNSGLVGSIDKSDLFTTPATVSNQFTIRSRTYNINGQFIPVAQTTITLAAAESTAARAVAFDDLFVESDGSYRHVRSINDRRTTTGFDADQIATDAGYTRVSQGLYSRAGNHALLLARISHRNQGAYHPLWNPEGTKGYAGPDDFTSLLWYQNDARKPTNSDETFVIAPAGPVSALSGAGTIARGVGRVTNPNDLYSDAIYADDITPLYYSARAVTDRKALLFDNFNRAVAGETFMGAEGTPNTLPFNGLLTDGWDISNTDRVTITGENTFSGNDDSSGVYKDLGLLRDLRYTIYIDAHIDSGVIELRNSSTGSGASFKIASGNNIQGFFTFVPEGEEGDTGLYIIIGNTGGSSLVTVTINDLSVSSVEQPSARPQFLYVDIIGATTAMPQEWLDNGIPGNWLAVGEEGEDLIPDGTSKDFKASRKVLELYLALATDDRGVTWRDVTGVGQPTGWKNSLESPANSGTSTLAANEVRVFFYRTSANPFELTDNLPVVDYSVDIPKLRSQSATAGSLLASHLFNKIPVEGNQALAPRRLLNSVTFSSTTREFATVLSGARKIEHLEFDGDVTTNPSIKVLGYLSNSYFVVIYKEIHYNGTSFGDDNQFDVVDNQSTVTDLNGETVIVGQKRVAVPYIFDGDLY